MARFSIPSWQRQKARQMRHEPTLAERQLWRGLRELRKHGIGHFRRQVPLGPYIVDFVDLGRRLVIEVDGGQHSNETDLKRDAWLGAEGFTVLHFWNNDVLGNTEGVLQTIQQALEANTPHPNPPPRGRGYGRTRSRLLAPTRKQGMTSRIGQTSRRRPLPLGGRVRVGGVGRRSEHEEIET